jgi:hypothetical protein
MFSGRRFVSTSDVGQAKQHHLTCSSWISRYTGRKSVESCHESSHFNSILIYAAYVMATQYYAQLTRPSQTSVFMLEPSLLVSRAVE